MGWSVVGALMLGCRISVLNGFDSLALACVLLRVVDCLRRLLEDIAPMMSVRAHTLSAMLCMAACFVFSTINYADHNFFTCFTDWFSEFMHTASVPVSFGLRPCE